MTANGCIWHFPLHSEVRYHSMLLLDVSSNQKTTNVKMCFFCRKTVWKCPLHEIQLENGTTLSVIPLMLTFVIPSKVFSTLQILSLVLLSYESSQPFTLLQLLYFSDPSNIQSSPAPSVTCPEGYTAFWYVCLKLVLTSTVSWADAESACQEEEANLVSIHNDAENSAVLLALEQSGNQPFWIGLHDPEVKILCRL